MKRINVTFYDEIYEKIVARAEKNGSKSLGHEVRELVDLALKIEAAAQKNSDSSIDEIIPKLLEMMTSNLVWMLETRLLTRHMVERLPDTGNENQIAILEKYKEKAANYVDGMINAIGK